MALSAGDKLGHYEVVSLLGRGGMGEVYRARDKTLKREVALKVLPAAFLRDPERMARFQREAQVLASLDHPNIGHIYGIVESEDSRGLVLALIEGPTLQDRIEAGPIPLDEAIAIAKQIIEALEYAHDRSVVHRDLKPGNIKITPDGVVKVLDFGLAKVLEDEPPAPSLADSPTLTLGHTRAGVILGTVAYMSPEQAVGRPVDRRSDIFSFGAVMFEMLAGKRAFAGATTPDVLEAVVKNEPDWFKLPAGTPAYLRLLLERMLVKDRKQRLQAIGEARIALESTPNSYGLPGKKIAPSMSRLGLAGWITAGVFALAAAGVSFLHFRETPPPETTLRLSVGTPFAVNYFALSPDGSTVAIAADKLWLRPLNSFEARPLSNTDDARHPFWSPDGRSIGFAAGGKLKIMSASGGPATALCDEGTGGGGTWNREGVILFGADKGPIERVNASGGACTPVTQAEPGVVHHLPTFLPDGNHFLYNALSDDPDKAGLYLAALDQPSGRRLLPDQSNAIFVPRRRAARHDQLLFKRENSLMAQPFDAETLQLAGDPFQVAPQLARTRSPAQVAASAAGNGTLVYLAGSSGLDFQPTWMDRSGKELGNVGPLGGQTGIALSPDQKSVALAFTGSASRPGIWLREFARDVETRFTLPPFVGAPVWSPDSSRIAFSGLNSLYVKNASGGTEQLLLQGRNAIAPSDWSRDGKYLLYTEVDPKTHGDIWYLPLDASGKPGAPVVFLKTESNESQGQFSPDGRWVAYVSNESGQEAVYVRPFPSGSVSIRISDGDGLNPRWRGDGKELYYYSGRLMAVSVQSRPGGPLQAGLPVALFTQSAHLVVPENNLFSYSPSADGQRFLMNITPPALLPTLNVIPNWEQIAGK